MANFENKLVLITGGSSGIGLSLAKQFSTMGANVWILARRSEQLEIAYKQIREVQNNIYQKFGTISADVSDYNLVQEKITKLINHYGAPDILINSAGVVHPGRFEDLDIEKFRWMIEINYLGMVNVIKVAIEAMIQRGSGHIVNISSMAGFLGIYGYTAYSASKFAVRGFSDVLRAELKLNGINVSIVYPPDTETPQLEYEEQFKPEITKEITSTSGRMKPDEVANKIIKGIVHKKYVITPGFEATLYYTIQSITGNLVYPVMDLMTSDARRKSEKR